MRDNGIWMIKGSHYKEMTKKLLDLSCLAQVNAGKGGPAYVPAALSTIGIGCVVMVVFGILEERGVDVRKRLAALPLPVTFVVYMALLVLIGMFGLTGVPRGFIYAQF